MSRSKKLAYAAFTENIKDAETLLSYAEGFNDQRKRRMRSELRDKVGEALSIPQRERQQLDCLHSEDVFMVFVPGGNLGNESFLDLRPLLRQSLVAACASLETYVADKAMEVFRQPRGIYSFPRRMKDIPLTVGRWAELDLRYNTFGRALRSIVDNHIQGVSSTAANRIAEAFSTVGVQDWVKRVDRARRVRAQARLTTNYLV